MKNLRKKKKWYMNAVKSYIVIHMGVDEKEARRAIKRYRLAGRINRYPDIQMHYSIKSTVQEMEEDGCLRLEAPLI